LGARVGSGLSGSPAPRGQAIAGEKDCVRHGYRSNRHADRARKMSASDKQCAIQYAIRSIRYKQILRFEDRCAKGNMTTCAEPTISWARANMMSYDRIKPTNKVGIHAARNSIPGTERLSVVVWLRRLLESTRSDCHARCSQASGQSRRRHDADLELDECNCLHGLRRMEWLAGLQRQSEYRRAECGH
jgi:hypothetical protein